MRCVRRVQAAHHRGHREYREKTQKSAIHRTKGARGAEIRIPQASFEMTVNAKDVAGICVDGRP